MQQKRGKKKAFDDMYATLGTKDAFACNMFMYKSTKAREKNQILKPCLVY